MRNIKDYNLDELKEEFLKLGEKQYRAEQVFKWIYIDEVTSFDEMTNLSKDLREKLTELMNKALEEGDFDKYDKLNERRTQLRAPEVVTSAPTNRVQPTFETESNVVDNADDKGVEEDDNTPIQFVSAGGEQPAF